MNKRFNQKIIVSMFMIVLIVMTTPAAASTIGIDKVETKVLNDNEVNITWDTIKASNTSLEYGFSKDNLIFSKGNNEYVTKHNLQLNYLASNTTFYFQAVSEDEEEREVGNNGGAYYDFKTYPTVHIYDVNVTDRKTNLAVVEWKTNIPTDSKVFYSNDSEDLKNKVEDTALTENHKLTLTNLKNGTRHYYAVQSSYKYQIDDNVPYTFKTRWDLDPPLFENLTIPEDGFYTQNKIDISGVTEPFSQVYLYTNHEKRFKNQNIIGQAGKFEFKNIKLDSGNNPIRLEAIDSSQNKNVYEFNITVDLEPPVLDVEKIPELIAERGTKTIYVKGNVSEFVDLTYYIEHITTDTEAPAKVTGLADKEIKSDRVDLVWDKSTAPDIKGYYIYKDNKHIDTQSHNTYRDNNVQPDTTYSYQVRAVDRNCNEGPKSDVKEITTLEGQEKEIKDINGTKYDCTEKIQKKTIQHEGDFELVFKLKEGNNRITIEAVDKAGNSAKFKHNLLIDTQPPKIYNIRPKSGSFFYEGTLGTELTVEGDTDPGAHVEVFVGNTRSTPETATADANGHFRVEDVNVEGGIVSGLFAGDISGFQAGGDTSRIDDSAVDPDRVGDESRIWDRQKETEVAKVIIRATDIHGYKTEKTVNYVIGTCSSGYLDWDIDVLSQYQAPTILNPERLAQGNEIISFIINLTYMGRGDNAKVNSIRLKPACKADHMKNDPSFNVSCKIIERVRPYQKGNDDKTMWYVQYRLEKTDDFKSYGFNSAEFWKRFKENGIIFPLMLTIRYSYEDEDGQRVNVPVPQKKCFEVAYFVDIPIAPKQWLPEGLIDFMIDSTSSVIEAIDDILPPIENALHVAGMGCLGTWLIKLFIGIFRRYSCAMEPYLTHALGDQGCPRKQIDEDTKRALSEEELNLKCPRCARWWNNEAQLYKIYRWVCDRVLCHKTPAAWTADKEKRTKLEEVERRNRGCKEKDKDLEKGYIITPRKADKEYQERFTHYYKIGTQEKEYAWMRKSEGDFFILEPIRFGAITDKEETLKVTSEGGGGAVFLSVAEANKAGITFKGKPDDRTTHYELRTCKDKVDETGKTRGKYQAEEEFGKTDWNYRLWKTRDTCYNENIYHPERDQSAAFGQNNWIYGEDLAMLTPQQHTTAFQSLCLSGIRNRLMALKNIMQGLHNCFSQIKTTGEASAGVCKEIFAQYICSFFWRMIKYNLDKQRNRESCIDEGEGVDEGEFANKNSLSTAISAVWESTYENAQDLNEDYGNAELEKYLSVGEQGFARKVCMGALTGDWGLDFDSIMDAAYSNTYNTHVSAWPASREYLTFNPATEEAIYDYRVAWQIVPGCALEDYRVDLSCINSGVAYDYGLNCQKAMVFGEESDDQSPNGCDCWNLPDEKIHSNYYSGKRLSQGVFEDRSRHDTVESMNRYDHVKISMKVKDKKVADKCLPEGHVNGVFYFPIEDITARDILDCHLDLIGKSGGYTCSAGALMWSKKGYAYLDTVKCKVPTSGEAKDCRDTYFSVGERMEFEVTGYNSGKIQCLEPYIMTKTGKIYRENPLKNIQIAAGHTEGWTLEEGKGTGEAFDKKIDFGIIKDEWFGLGKAKLEKSEGECTLTITETAASPSIGQVATITFKDYKVNRYENYVINTGGEKEENDYTRGMEFEINGFKAKISPPTIPPRDEDTDEVKDITCRFTVMREEDQQINVDEPQEWKLFLKVTHPLSDNNCDGETEPIEKEGKTTEMTIPFTVKKKGTAIIRDRCAYKEGRTINAKACDCDGDGDKDGTEDCDGITKKFCYDGECQPKRK